MCIASKVQHAVTVAREAIKYGKCVVIGLQSTGEARTLEQLERDEGELNDFVSTAKGVIQSLIERHFPAPDRNRINRLLGLDTSSKTMLERIMEENDDNSKMSSVSNKRKTYDMNNLPQKRLKTSQLLNGSDEDADDFEDNDKSSDYVVNSDSSNTSEEEDDEVHFDSSEENSDYNPFGNSSDSDSDPWVSKQKSKKKVKKEKKKIKKEENGNGQSSKSSSNDAISAALKRKPQTVQEKLQEQLAAKKQQNASSGVGVIKIEVPGMNNIAPIHIKPAAPQKDNIERACEMKEVLMKKIEKLSDNLPPNTLDQLIDELGGPENVAEMTGRKGRVVQNEDGSIQYESRSEQDVPLETLNLTEKSRFMDGEKDVAIISEAASSGV